MKKFLVASFALCLLSSCSVSMKSGPLTDNPGGGGTGDVKPSELNGMSPEQAYGQFILKTSGKCEDNSLRFHPYGVYEIDLGKSASGNSLYASATVYMKPDNKYWAQYDEYEKGSCETHDGLTQCPIKNLRHQEFEDVWYIDADKLVFRGLAQGSYLTFNGKPAMFFTLNASIPSQTAKAQIGWSILTNTGYKGESIRHYCDSQ
jgi:hypothetical protein